MSLFPQQFIDDLSSLQANIVQVVQEYVPLKRAGTTYKGLCPFHSEKTPSFHVNPDKGFFHCFGCGAGRRRVQVPRAAREGRLPGRRQDARAEVWRLPARASEGSSDDGRRDAGLREALLKMHEVAADYFREQLAAAAGARARQQLAERGVSAKTIEQLGLGYAPASRDGLKARLLKQGFAQGLLIQSGLVVARDNGEIVDRFRNRLMVPICRDAGSVIAFGGRSMDADQVPKYLNSPETAIYSKGRTLYGLNLTKAAIRKLGFVVLVEGYFDFAQLFQSDAAPVVASCGTALTPQQAQLLRRFTSKVVLSFDPDAAGQGAAATILRTPGQGRVRGQRGGAGQGRRSRYVYPTERPRPVSGQIAQLAAVSRVPARSGGRGTSIFGDPETQRTFLAEMLAVAAWLPDAAMRDQFADKVAHHGADYG